MVKIIYLSLSDSSELLSTTFCFHSEELGGISGFSETIR
jgi:hypothetical protein